jgi:hypothetical protein
MENRIACFPSSVEIIPRRGFLSRFFDFLLSSAAAGKHPRGESQQTDSKEARFSVSKTTRALLLAMIDLPIL